MRQRVKLPFRHSQILSGLQYGYMQSSGLEHVVGQGSESLGVHSSHAIVRRNPHSLDAGTNSSTSEINMQITLDEKDFYEFKTYVWGAKKNRLIETVLLSTHNMCFSWEKGKIFFNNVPGRVAQSVTCLATDACLTEDPGVASSNPARYHTFVEIDHEIISTVILLPSADLFKKGCCQLQAKVCAQITG